MIEFEVEFEVYGVPVGKGRPRFTKSGRTYTPEKTINYESMVRVTYQLGAYPKLEGEIFAEIEAFFPIPKSVSKKKKQQMLDGVINPTKKPDGDNIIKSILDALNGIAYDDDSQVVFVSCKKSYGEIPRVNVRLAKYNLEYD